MERHSLKTGVGATIFIFLMISTLALISPAYRRLNALLSLVEKTVVTTVGEKTGLVISYDSLSPSVLAGLNFKGIVISDAADGEKILEVNRLTLSYDFWKFFSKQPVYAIKSITINGMTIEYDAVQDASVRDRLSALIPHSDKKEKETVAFDTENLSFQLPFLVQLKNIALHYADQNNEGLLTLRNLALKTHFDDDGVEIKTEGRVMLRTSLVKTEGRRSVFADSFSLSGTLLPDLEGSSATLQISGVNSADYTLTHGDFLVNLNKNHLQARTMRSVLPYSVFFDIDLSRQDFKIETSFDSFDPFSLVRIRKMSDGLKKIRGSTISGNMAMRREKGELSYGLDTSLAVSKKLLGSELLLSSKVSGSSTQVTVDSFSVKGDLADIDFSGTYDIQKMLPSGTLSVNQITLPNGNIIATEFYIDPMDSGFLCFSPQLFMADRSLTALQLMVIPAEQSIDFAFECDDYSHADYDQSAHIAIDGSYLRSNNSFVQAHVSVSDLFIDSVLKLCAVFLEKDQAETMVSLASSAENYLCTNEMYLSSDFNSFSFNAPYFLVANTKNDGDLLVFALDGSNQTIQLSSLDLQFGDFSTRATAMADFSQGFNDFTFFGDLTVNSLPYRFNGSYAEDWLSVSGDYDLAADIALGDFISGSLRFSALPVALGKTVLSFTTDTSFSWSKEAGPGVDIQRLSFEEAGGETSLNPAFSLSGEISNYGFVMSSLAYSDSYSELNGSGEIIWNINENIIDSLHVSLNMDSLLSEEKIAISADLTNPTLGETSRETLLNDFYLSCQADIQRFVLERFMPEQNVDNTASLTASVTGTLTNPFGILHLSNLSLNLAGSPFNIKGDVVLDDTGLHATEMSAKWKGISFSDLYANYNPQDFSAEAGVVLDGEILDWDFHAPVTVKTQALSQTERWGIPESFMVLLDSPAFTGTMFPSGLPVSLSLVRSPGSLYINSNEGRGISLSLFDNGSLSGTSGPDSFFRFKLNGDITDGNMNIEVLGISTNMGTLSKSITIPYVDFTDGDMSGSLKIGGIVTDPEFSGAFVIRNPEFVVPYVSPSKFRSEKVLATIVQSSLSVPQTKFTLGKGEVLVDTRIDFDRWSLGLLDSNFTTEEGEYVPVEMTYPFIHYKGDAGLDLNLQMAPSKFAIYGNIYPQNCVVEVIPTSLETEEDSTDFSMQIVADLNFLIGQKVQLLFNPVLRGLVTPGTPLTMYVDSYTGDFTLKGDVSLRGGEIVWLSRNFYLKEGRVQFNETNELFDPRLTVRAETRERDEDNNQVTISLTSQGQPLSTFNPRLSATPAKSEAEIMELMGQIVTADSANVGAFAMAGGDYLVQATVIRQIENALRELLNFDIFSIRTMVLQNAVKSGMSNDSDEKQTTFGNFFDNSTVYIGKYFGSSVYIDALMHWTYDDTKLSETTSRGLVFQPEFGLEMSSPFVNIRWGIAPDIEALQTQTNLKAWVPATSITLSWKLSF